jgi:hypothetical protein
MKAKDFDRKFDEGGDITDDLDLAKASRPGQEQRRVNVDFPTWMIESLDREAKRLGVTRQSIIKVWIAERLDGRTEKSQRENSESSVTCEPKAEYDPGTHPLPRKRPIVRDSGGNNKAPKMVRPTAVRKTRRD